MRKKRLLPILAPCLLVVLFACEPRPNTAPCVLQTDPDPLVITEDTYSLTFYGVNFAPDAYLSIHGPVGGPSFTYYCTDDDYYGHTCPYGLYATYSFEDVYGFLSSFFEGPPPHGGRFKVFNVGANLVNDAGGSDDRPSGFVAFELE